MGQRIDQGVVGQRIDQGVVGQRIGQGVLGQRIDKSSQTGPGWMPDSLSRR